MNVPAVFFDKDGTLVEDVPYNADTDRVRLATGAISCLHLLRAAGYKLFIISNQPGIELGLVSEADLIRVQRKIEELSGVGFDGFYFCPHGAEDGGKSCGCRKPAPELLYRAAAEHHLALEKSWLVGDILNDVEAGRRAGMRTVFLDVGNETEWKTGELRKPDFTAGDLVDAAYVILKESNIEQTARQDTFAADDFSRTNEPW